MIHDLNLTINYWIYTSWTVNYAVLNDFNKKMSIIVVCQIARGYLLFSLVNSGLTITSMYSSVSIMAVCSKGRWTNFFTQDRRSDHKNRVHSLTGWFLLAWDADIQKGRARVCEKHYHSYLNKCCHWLRQRCSQFGKKGNATIYCKHHSKIKLCGPQAAQTQVAREGCNVIYIT